jgi:hypothetical protein
MKHNLLVITLLAVLIFTSTTGSSSNIMADKSPGVNDYVMNLALDTVNKTLTGNERVNYINNTKTTLNELHFHVYSNSAVFRALSGGIDIKSIFINNKISNFNFECEDKSMIKIKLKELINPNQRINILFNYKIKIPATGINSSGCRFGYGKQTYNLGNFFPIAAVYDANGWDIHPYDIKGDAFYSETSNFDVTITAPKSQVIAASGLIYGIKAAGNNNIWQIKACSVRDFAFVASHLFKIAEGKVDGVSIKAYGFNKETSKKVLKIGMDAIRIFDNKYGKYPYKTCSIAQANIRGGMEYPNLVMINSISYESLQCAKSSFGKVYDPIIAPAEFEIVHELAHQWWYGLVGNDEYREAWIDEPLAQCSTLDYFNSKYGAGTYNKVLKEFINYGYYSFEKTKNKKQNISLRRDLSKFESREYTALIYSKGAMMFNNLRIKLGNTKFNLFEKTLFNNYKFKIIKGSELISLASKIAGQDMTEFFHRWLETSYVN